MSSKKKRKHNHLVIISVIILFVVTAGVFYCIKAYVDKQKNKSVLITNTVTMNYTDEYNGVIIPATSIYSDQDGKLITNKENIFDFVVSTKINNSTKTNYKLYLKKDKQSNIPDDMVKIYLQSSKDDKFTKVKEEILPIKYKEDDDSKGMLLKTDTLSKNTKIYYRLRVWIDQNYMANNPNDFYKAVVNINAK